jgi:beta-phosphoglucomutase-like phosphatase (HAD superfamily)
MAGIRAVLFDIDGTLLDSNDAHAHAWLDSLRGHGRSVPFGHVRSRIGMGGDKLLMEVAGIDAESVEGRSIDERRSAILKAYYLPDLGPCPGARMLVERLRSRGLALAAVSSAKREDLQDLVREAGVADLIETLISADDAAESKPDPDLVEVALDRLAVTADEAIMIGDSPYDVEAGRRAGVAVIALRCGGFPERSLAGAIAIYDDPQAFAIRLDEVGLERGTDFAFPPSSRTRRPRRSAYL